VQAAENSNNLSIKKCRASSYIVPNLDKLLFQFQKHRQLLTRTHDKTLAAAELRQKARDWLAKSAVNRLREDPEAA